jgi:hypothetical protein
VQGGLGVCEAAGGHRAHTGPDSEPLMLIR